jgi:MraZ protein
MPTDSQTEPIDYLYRYDHGVDSKRRVQVPAKWRPAAEEPEYKLRLLLWQPVGQKAPCLLGLPPDQWQRLRAKIAGMNLSDRAAQEKREWIAANCDVVTLDSAGRICLPKELAEAAGIGDKVVLQGMTEYFAIWSDTNYALEHPKKAGVTTGFALDGI